MPSNGVGDWNFMDQSLVVNFSIPSIAGGSKQNGGQWWWAVASAGSLNNIFTSRGRSSAWINGL